MDGQPLPHAVTAGTDAGLRLLATTGQLSHEFYAIGPAHAVTHGVMDETQRRLIAGCVCAGLQDQEQRCAGGTRSQTGV